MTLDDACVFARKTRLAGKKLPAGIIGESNDIEEAGKTKRWLAYMSSLRTDADVR